MDVYYFAWHYYKGKGLADILDIAKGKWLADILLLLDLFPYVTTKVLVIDFIWN